MTSRRRFTALAIILVLFRCFPSTWYEAFDFDSDQAVVGLMAKHLSEGRTFPLFFYGQHYMLGVQSWLAAPFFLLGGPTVLMLRAPLVLINCAVAVLLLILLIKDGDLRPAYAFVATLPFVMPSAVVAPHLLQTLGASVEPFLYVLLLWMLRRRPIPFGVLLAIGFLHREFTIFAVPALIGVMALDRTLFTRATLERALTMVVPVVAVWVIIDLLKMKVDVYGPATGRIENGPLNLEMASMLSRICVNPREVAVHARSMFVDCLPDLIGGRTFPLAYHSINSTVVAGSDALGWLLVGAAALAAVRLVVLLRRQTGSTEAPFFCEYLALVGIQALAVYPLACEVMPGYPGLLRYVLLGLQVPIGLGAVYLKRETVPVLRAIAVGVFVVWAGVNLAGNIRVVNEYRLRPPDNKFRQLVDYLENRRIKYARAGYWDAYIVDFLSGERVVVASDEKIRVRDYQQQVDAHPAEAARILREPCAGGVHFQAWCIDR